MFAKYFRKTFNVLVVEEINQKFIFKLLSDAVESICVKLKLFEITVIREEIFSKFQRFEILNENFIEGQIQR